MKIIKFAPLIVSLLMLMACDTNTNTDKNGETPQTSTVMSMLKENVLPEECPEDFSFSFMYGCNIDASYNGIDSELGTVSKDLFENGTSSTAYKISNEDMQNIYSEIIKYNIAEICNLGFDITSENLAKFEGKDDCVMMTPCEKYIFKFCINGVYYTLRGDYSGFDHPKKSEIRDDFTSFVKFMKSYVENTKSYKSLPEAVGGYD